MSLHKGGLSQIAPLPVPLANPWLWSYPNTADFNFNYYNLLNASQGAIAKASNMSMPIAVIGTGVAGLLAARELYRCGYNTIDIYEATNRIGGRNYSLLAPAPGGGTQSTVYEMGAMRMPFFTQPGADNCLLDYLCQQFNIATTPFPDPGSSVVAQTGIYINEGWGPDGSYSTPTMDMWAGNGNPPNQIYSNILAKWIAFKNLFTGQASQYYGTSGWTAFWQSVVSNYWMTNFRELALMAPITQVNPQNPGYFGGLGLTEDESTILYVIGVGDGGWGAFYDVSCLYVIRTILFGFADNHQLIRGRYINGTFTPGPQYGLPTRDTLGNLIVSPTYLGIQSIAECLFFLPVSSPYQPPGQSLYQACSPNAANAISFFSQMPVTAMEPYNYSLNLYSAQYPSGKNYSAVIATPTTWALEMSPNPMASPAKTFFNGFSVGQMPIEVTTAIKESHGITSSKVFWPLKQRYWGQGLPIPQVISTDTFLQDIYGIAASDDDPGVILISYTWEDDATKLESDDDNTLALRCLNELDRILMRTLNTTISQYVNTDASPIVMHWEQQPTYRTCAKLYREGSFDMDYSLLTWNQNMSTWNGLYFAGESYSVEGGWTEPALRMALDAVVNLINNTKSAFTVNDFTMADYPKYSAWSPSDAASAGVAMPPGAAGAAAKTPAATDAR